MSPSVNGTSSSPMDPHLAPAPVCHGWLNIPHASRKCPNPHSGICIRTYCVSHHRQWVPLPINSMAFASRETFSVMSPLLMQWFLIYNKPSGWEFHYRHASLHSKYTAYASFKLAEQGMGEGPWGLKDIFLPLQCGCSHSALGMGGLGQSYQQGWQWPSFLLVNAWIFPHSITENLTYFS